MPNQRKVARSIDRARAALSEIESEMLTRGEPEPKRPDPEPEEPTPERPTRTLPVVRVEIEYPNRRASETVELAPDANELATEERGWRFWQRKGFIADAHYRVFWEQFPGGTWPTVILTPRKGTGAAEWGRVSVKVDGRTIYDLRGENAECLPSQAHIATTRPTDASGWQTDDDRVYPPWSEGAMRADRLRREQQRFMGRPFFWADGSASGATPQDPGAPAGHGVGFYSAGKDDAFCGPEGKANRWAECLGEGWKAIWRLDDSGEPALVEGGYWSGRDYAQNRVRGYEWEPYEEWQAGDSKWNGSQRKLAKYGRPADGPHFRRFFRAPAALARWSAAARFMLQVAWADVQSAWNLDGPEMTNAEDPTGLLRGFQCHLADPPRWPAPTGLRGSRYFAQAVGCLVEAWDYIDRDVRERYAEAFVEWYLAISDANGMANRDRSGDAATNADKAGIGGVPTSAFQSMLIVANMQRLAALRGGPGPLASRLGTAARFLGDTALAYCWESETPPMRGETWQDRKHSARAELAEKDRSWSPDYGSYLTAINGSWVMWPDAQAMDARAQQVAVNGDTPYDLVPRSAWEGAVTGRGR